MIARTLACLLLSASLFDTAQARDYRYSDAHLHYVDFFQETEGMPALLKAMDEAGVEPVSYTHLTLPTILLV